VRYKQWNKTAELRYPQRRIDPPELFGYREPLGGRKAAPLTEAQTPGPPRGRREIAAARLKKHRPLRL